MIRMPLLLQRETAIVHYVPKRKKAAGKWQNRYLCSDNPNTLTMSLNAGVRLPVASPRRRWQGLHEHPAPHVKKKIKKKKQFLKKINKSVVLLQTILKRMDG